MQDGCDVRAHGVMCVHGPCMHGWVKWVGEMGVGCTGPECYEISRLLLPFCLSLHTTLEIHGSG
eukprot:SAG25_NODE_3_length_30426_cov_8.268210_33_plen_64_part_00